MERRRTGVVDGIMKEEYVGVSFESSARAGCV